MTLINRLFFFIADGANKRRPNMSNLSTNPSVDEVDSLLDPTNYLDQVIFRVQFTREVDDSKELAKDFYNLIKDIFPEKRNTISNVLEAKIEPPEKAVLMQGIRVGPKVTQTQRTLVLPSFLDPTKRKHIYFEPQALIIRQEKSYTRFSDFCNMVKIGIKAFSEVYGKNTAVRQVVLQYVNNIKDDEGDALDWKGKIKDELISVINFSSSKEELTRAMNLIELTKEGYGVRFQSGLFNVDYPNVPIKRKEFILDYACYSKQECKIEDTIGLADTFHSEIKKLFKACVEGNLKSKFEGLEDEK